MVIEIQIDSLFSIVWSLASLLLLMMVVGIGFLFGSAISVGIYSCWQ